LHIFQTYGKSWKYKASVLLRHVGRERRAESIRPFPRPECARASG